MTYREAQTTKILLNVLLIVKNVLNFPRNCLPFFRAEKKAYSTAAIAKEGQIEKMLWVFNEEKEKKEKLTRRQQVAKKRQAEKPDNREAKANKH